MSSARLIACCAAASACAANVAQDAHSGADSKVKGAREITLDNGEGKAKGIVTYPGGDRVDWKFVTLPDGKIGQLDVKLQWVPPRPNLQLAFDVFDEWNYEVGHTKKTSKRKSRGRVRTATIENAKGKYYIRVYAVGRGDAGSYKLTVDFKEDLGPIAFDMSRIDVADPPRLAEVPPPDFVCDDQSFDPKKFECRSFCPSTGAPRNWPGCKGICPDPPDVNLEACQRTMPCPRPPDRRVLACKPSSFPKCADINNPDPDNPNCDHATAAPVKGRVLDVSVAGGETVIVISVGSDQGVRRDWRGKVLRGDSDGPMDGGEITIVRVDKRQTIAKVRLTTDQINSNPYVKLSAPPK